MGLYIKDIEMPKSCVDCFCASIFAGYKCMACDRQFDKYPLENKMDWCPLVSVPSHGRLIDADELKTAFPCCTSVRTGCVRATINNAPTIIPAEEGET